jgi:hypothetical protein
VAQRARGRLRELQARFADEATLRAAFANADPFGVGALDLDTVRHTGKSG